ncbi:MAG: hypothetical protein LJE95_16050, partial [Acidobacteria bacterium]|nr:hypothetical protein [Acidobacteriota bacterium]
MDRSRHEVAGVFLVLVTGAGNIVAEAVLHRKTAFVLFACALWLAWAAMRLRGDPTALRMWGFRRDNWRDSASRVIVFVVSASALMLAAAPLLGHWPISSHVWIVLGAYPVWALAQQFLLCAVLARGLAHWLPARAVPATAGLLFALAHVPDLLLVVLTFVAGMVFVALYQRRPNLWVQALGHAVLGTLAYYAILGRDPVAAL